MADRTYRSGRERHDRDRYHRQAEQFDAADYGWRDDERGYGQMGEGWRDEDYGQFDTAGQSYSRDRQAARDWGRDPSYARRNVFRARGHADAGYGTERTSGRGASYGAGSQLAANHGEWREPFTASPSREYRDYRGTWGGLAGEGRGWLDRASDTVSSWFSDDDDDRHGDRGYRGHGPSGYTRSDGRIMEDACDCLTDDWGVDARQISVTVKGGEVTLDGTVPSRQQKRRAEDLIDDLSGVKHVQNNLRVQESAAWDRDNGGEFARTEPTG